MACSFGIESMARGYHEYKSVWEDPVHGEELNCTRDIGNSHDPMAVAILKEIDGATVTVGHVPRRISALCSVFIRRGGTIRCIVNGDRRYSADLPQGGLEIPCRLVFTAKTSVEADKAKKHLQSSLVDCAVQEQETASITTKPNVALSSKQAAEASIVTKAEQQLSVAVSQVDLTTESAAVPTECSPSKKRQRLFDAEHIIMGNMLTDLEINLAQQLLKSQFDNLNGLQSTLLQEKAITVTKSELQNKLQVIFCKERQHWIVATTIKCDENEVKVYDSLFSFLDQDSLQMVQKLFTCSNVNPSIQMMRCPKQKGVKDCGVYAIAIATALAFGSRPAVLRQDKMRPHLVNCFNRQQMSLFPCK